MPQTGKAAMNRFWEIGRFAVWFLLVLVNFSCQKRKDESDYAEPAKVRGPAQSEPVALPDSFREILAKAIEDAERAGEIASKLPVRIEFEALTKDIENAQRELLSLQRSLKGQSLAKEANKDRLDELEGNVETLESRRSALLDGENENLLLTKELVEADLEELNEIYDWWFSPRVDVKIKQWRKFLEDDKDQVEIKELFEKFDFVTEGLRKRKLYLERQIGIAEQVDSAIKSFLSEFKTLFSMIRQYPQKRSMQWNPDRLLETKRRFTELEAAWREGENMQEGLPPRTLDLSLSKRRELGQDLQTRLTNLHCLLERTSHEFAWAAFYLSLARNHGEELEEFIVKCHESEKIMKEFGDSLLKEAKSSLYGSQTEGILKKDITFYAQIVINSEKLSSALSEGFHRSEEALDVYYEQGELESKTYLHSVSEDFLVRWKIDGCPPLRAQANLNIPKRARLFRSMSKRESFLRLRSVVEHERFMAFAAYNYLDEWRAASQTGDQWAPLLLAACYREGRRTPMNSSLAIGLEKLAKNRQGNQRD